MRTSQLGFPVSRSLGNEKPGNRPKTIEGKGLPASWASSKIPHVGKPKSDQPQRPAPENRGALAAEDHSGVKEEQRTCPSPIDPALKSWFDNVIIPSLVRNYLFEREESKRAQKPGKPPLAIVGEGIYARHDSEQKQ